MASVVRATTPRRTTTAKAPNIRLNAGASASRFHRRSSAAINRPIQVTGWPIDRSSQSGEPAMSSINTATMVSGTAMTSDSGGRLEHGGDMATARRLFPEAPQPFIDLSTGINPHPSPLPPLGANVFARLPDSAAQFRLSAIAAETYGAPSAAH